MIKILFLKIFIYDFKVKSYIVEKSVKSNPIEFDVIGEKSTLIIYD